MIIKNRSPQFLNYIYEDGIELDFFIDKHLLAEVKYGRELNEKQTLLFKNFTAKHKLVVQNIHEIEELERHLLRDKV